MQGKSFITAVYASARAILYPNTYVVIASGTRGQATEIVRKIELMATKSSLLESEIVGGLKGIKTNNDAGIKFRNGSTIRVVASNDNARSGRANVLILDEFRMIDLSVIDTVLRKFQTVERSRPFLLLDKYKDRVEEFAEPNKEIYLSSCWYKLHWAWDKTTDYFEKMSNGSKYVVCSLPYQLAVKENLYPMQKVIEEMSESTFDEIKWLMEMDAMWYGENATSYFKLNDFNKCRRGQRYYYPPDLREKLPEPHKFVLERESDEIRVVSYDVATSKKTGSDNSVIFLSIVKKVGGVLRREIVYGESLPSKITQHQVLRVKQILEDFNSDYLVIDAHNVGTVFIDLLGDDTVDSENGVTYPPIRVFNNEDLAQRCVRTDAEPIIYAINATNSLNSTIAKSFRTSLRNNSIILPVHENDTKDFLRKKFPSFDDAELRGTLMLPNIQTTLMINESIALEAEYKENNRVTLREVGGKRKDRYTSISYLNHFVTEYLEVENKSTNGFDVSKLQFMMRTPTFY